MRLLLPPVRGRGRVREFQRGLSVCPKQGCEARALLTDRTIRRRAKWVGLLYQPESWREQKPDPAVVS